MRPAEPFEDTRHSGFPAGVLTPLFFLGRLFRGLFGLGLGLFGWLLGNGLLGRLLS